MGYIVWSKSYSAADNGSIFAGTDLQNIQSDITTVVNGGLTNSNVSASAVIAESKLAFDITSGHYHDGVGSRAIASGGFRAFIQGAELEYVSAATTKAQSGALDIAGTIYTRVSYSTTINMATDAHWVEATSQEAVSTWFYVYAYNDSGSTYDIKFWAQPPQYANTGTDDSSVKIYRQNAGVWYRCIGAVYNDSAGDLDIWYQHSDFVMWDIPVNVSSATSAGAWSAAISCAAAMPALSQLALFGVESQDVDAVSSGAWIRPNGTTWTTNSVDGSYIRIVNGTSAEFAPGSRMCGTDSSQQIQVYHHVGDNSCNVTLHGYWLNIR